MKLQFTLAQRGSHDWTLALHRKDTDEQLLTLTGLRSQAEARHTAESLRAAVHVAAVVRVDENVPA